MKIMEAFTLFFSYDVMLIVLLTAIYVLYSAINKQLSRNYALFIWIFTLCYYILFYLLSLKNLSDAKSLFQLCLLPTFTFFHWLIPFKKNKKITRVLAIISGIYIFVILFMFVVHYFFASKM
jgi:drug/metabolite transporter superfamily protein YnfA